MAAHLRLTFAEFEKSLFSFLETESWPDTLFCIAAYVYVIAFLATTLFLPLVFFGYVFLFAPG